MNIILRRCTECSSYFVYNDGFVSREGGKYIVMTDEEETKDGEGYCSFQCQVDHTGST